MIAWSAPRRTKYVPITEVTMHTAPITSGSSITVSRSGGWKKMFASSIVATIVTA